MTPNILASLRVTAIRDNLHLITGFVQAVAYRLKLDDLNAFAVELSVEEAAANIIHHAYKPDNPGIMEFKIGMLGDDLLVVILTDWGIPFPVGKIKPFDPTAPVETRIHGGMGLHLIHNLMDSVQREVSDEYGNPNTLTLTKRIQRVENLPPVTTRREHRELNALKTISEVMSSQIELDDLLRIIINKLVETIQAERGTLYLVDEERGECWSKILIEDEHILPEIRIKIGEGIAGRVAETGEILNIINAHEHPLFNPVIDRVTGFYTRNILAVPMRNPRQKVIGVVQLLNKIGGDFTTADERLLVAMASQAAISIENARLYKQELQQKLLERELHTAAEIQESFLPESIPQVAGWDIAAFWKPVKGVAGDFYDFRVMEDGRLAVIIADVSGKGIPAALFMALTVIALRMGMSLNLNPHDLIVRTNLGIIEHQSSRMFATIFVGYLDTQTGQFEYTSAGHNPPILYRAATQTCDYLTGHGVAIGVFQGAKYEAETVQLYENDVLVLYTDGITEIINAGEEEFGEERLEAFLNQHKEKSATELLALMVHEVHDFAGDQNSFDDETLIIIKRAAKPH